MYAEIKGIESAEEELRYVSMILVYTSELYPRME
jgi:hypothetical protein